MRRFFNARWDDAPVWVLVLWVLLIIAIEIALHGNPYNPVFEVLE